MEKNTQTNDERNDHMTSLRLPQEWHDWILRFAEKFNVKPAYVYRSCVRDFMHEKSFLLPKKQ